MAEPGRFTLADLPYGSVRRAPDAPARLCVALGNCAVELGSIADRLRVVDRQLIDAPNLDRLLAADAEVWASVRAGLGEALADGPPPEACVPLEQAVFGLPFTVGDYVDFYSSLEHATNLGRILRPGS